MALRLKASQDGADFYVQNADGEDDHPLVVTYPLKVKDGDVLAAQRAAAWFKQYCIDQGWGIVPLED